MEEGVDVDTDCHIEHTLTPHLQTDNVATMENVEVLHEILAVKNEVDKLQDVDDVLRENDKVEKSPEENLSGWLHLRGRGIANLIGAKQRWFQYGKENCKLYCYRDPQDLVPLGEINIATASFYFDAGNQDKPGMFKIKADGKEISLDAGNRHNMMFWLQALQSKRRQFNISRSSFSTESVGYLSNTRANNLCGLVTKEIGQASAVNHLEPFGGTPVTSDIPEIQVPDCDCQGSNNSLNNLPSTGSKPFNNIKAELQQMWSTLKLPVFAKKNSGPLSERLSRVMQPQESSESVFYCEINPPDDVELVSLSNANITSNDSQKNDNIYKSSLCSVNESLIREIRESDESALNNANLNQNCNNSDNETAECSSWAIIEKTNLISEDILQQQPSNPLPPKRDKMQQKMSAAGGQSENDKLQKLGTNRNQSQNSSSTQGKLLSSFRKIRFGRRQISEPVFTHDGAAVVSGIDTVQSSSGNATNNLMDAKDLTQSTISSCKDIEDLEQEVKANREIILVLQCKVDALTLELQARLQAGEVSDEKKTEMLVEREKQLTELQKMLEKSKEEYSITVEKLRATEAALHSSQDQVVMFTDMLKAKDEIVMTLTNQIFDHDQVKQQVTPSCDQPDVVQSLSSRDSSMSMKVEKVNIRELESYKDMCQGYELQHKFLTKEILELNDLRKDDIAREKAMMIEFAKMQAKYYQIKSKYYVLLKQQHEQSPKREGEDDQAVVNQLLQDALEADRDDIEMHLTGSGQEYDRYGFSCQHLMDGTLMGIEDDRLGNKAVVFERQSEELSNKVKEADKDTSLRVKWENYMVGRGGILQRSQELKNLIRHGVPHEYREEVWKGCVNFYVGDVREKAPGYYQSLLKKKEQSSGSDPAIKQIELDLLRTLPNNKHYETIESEGTVKLRNILLAFSEYNRIIGYCQGLNRLAAIALLFMSEEDAFWCLVAIVDYILPPDYFSATLMAAQADQRVLKDLVQEKLPKIHQKLEAQNVDLSLFTFNWFLTIFVDNVPVETFLRIWDTFLYEGSKVLFRFAAAFLKIAEEEILKQQDGLQLNKCLRKLGESMTNVKQIAWYAFNWINPFSMKFLATRRQQHLHDVNLELEELEKLRSGTKMDRRGKQPYFNSDDELDSLTD